MTSEPCYKLLPNGLSIYLLEIHTAPIISHWVWYRVGSRYETAGLTGISHWVEHMQFKGTPRFPASHLDKAISRTGGVWNAFTYLDWTTFYETLPASQIDLALDLERDRMTDSLFDPAEVEAERSVILAELEGNQNEPRFRLGEAVQKTAFDHHPYRNEVIGSREDLKRIQRSHLFAHYQRYYQPSNAVIAVAGDFDTGKMLDRLTNCYAGVSSIPKKACEVPLEPLLTAERRVEVTGPGSTTFLQLAYRAPAASNPDFFPLAILDSLLCGPTSLNMFGGGGTTNKTSRLYKALVETELAVGVRGGIQATIDPFLYEISVTLRQERTPDQVLAVVNAQVARLQEEPVPEAEIARAAKQARAMFVYGSENITNQAFWLGYAEMFARYGWFVDYVKNLAQVTPADVQRVARNYLQTQQRVVGIYLPERSP
ncbi:MAG: insulinase family protein [Anaerolinea sp.]|nr:insulinase family protein [Anaerolinea sp.]